MAANFSRSMLAPRFRTLISTAAVLSTIVLLAAAICLAQTAGPKNGSAVSGPESPPKPAAAKTPLTDSERAELLELIRTLQERVTKLEAAQAAGAAGAVSRDATATAPPLPAVTTAPAETASANEALARNQDDTKQDDPNVKKGVPIQKPWGMYEPGAGFKIGQTELASLNISGYVVARYLNQNPANQTSFTDHLGRSQSVKPRQDFQFHRAMVYLQGFAFNPKVAYNITLWTVNDTGQVAIIGALTYAHNKHLMVGMGWNGLPGTRSIHGSHPYWPSYDRVMADEFFRPYFTSGLFAQGEIVPGLKYDAMIGNNLSQLGISAAKLTRDLAKSVSLTWQPTTHEFGPRNAFGDFEGHNKLATQFGIAYTRSREDRFNTNGSTFPDNTIIRLADSLALFETGALANGVTVQKASYQLFAADAGMKYKGFWLQAEGYYRILDNFIADGALPLRTIQDKGFYVQSSYMIVPKKFELYGATSWIFSQMGKPKEFIGGANYYPFENRNFRMNLHVINVDESAVSSTFGFYTGGLKGWSLSTGTTLLF